ncbi:MAG: EamA family transporter [Alcaligenaceae bacterium]|nr:EamA family transporter [Alcaligenaceae bacterium]
MPKPVITHSRSTWLALLMTVISVTSVQLGASLSVPVILEYGVLSTSFQRLAWAAVVLCLFVRPPMHRYTRAQWRAALMLGAGMTVMTVSFFVALQTVPQHLVVAVEFCGPLLVAVWGVRRLTALIWPVLAAVGIGLLLLGNSEHSGAVDLFGFCFALLAGTGWATYIVMMKRVGTAFKGLEGLTTSLTVAAVLTLPLGLIESGGTFPPMQLAYTAGLALLVPLFPYILEINALRRLPASVFGILMSLEPAAGALTGWIVLDQFMSSMQMLGMTLVIAASLGVVGQQSRSSGAS